MPDSPSSFTSFVKQITSWNVVSDYQIIFETKTTFPLMAASLSMVSIVSRAAAEEFLKANPGSHRVLPPAPNCIPPMIFVVTVRVAAAISLEATHSFLGIGLPVTEPSLDLLISNGFAYMLSGRYWISFYPGMALLFAIVSINLVGDQLRDILNPRL